MDDDEARLIEEFMAPGMTRGRAAEAAMLLREIAADMAHVSFQLGEIKQILLDIDQHVTAVESSLDRMEIGTKQAIKSSFARW